MLKPKLYTSRQYLERRFKKQKWTVEQIAEECGGVSRQTIYNYLEKFGLK